MHNSNNICPSINVIWWLQPGLDGLELGIKILSIDAAVVFRKPGFH